MVKIGQIYERKNSSYIYKITDINSNGVFYSYKRKDDREDKWLGIREERHVSSNFFLNENDFELIKDIEKDNFLSGVFVSRLSKIE